MKITNILAESNDGVDVIRLTVPLFIRLIEWAKEEAVDDVELHQLVERIVTIDGIIDMEDYDYLMEFTDDTTE